jgi:hypothetical protein
MCVILFKKFNNNIIIAKNRDRFYKPKIQIIHEIINGIEIAYIKDLNTEWCEGLNEYGFGIVNTALEVDNDENPFNISNDIHIKSKKIYLNALSQLDPITSIDIIFNKDFYSDIGLQGHNFIASSKPNFCLRLESFKDNKPFAEIIRSNSYVCTNHGINLKVAGYLDGDRFIGSILRKKIIETELKDIDSINYEDIFLLLNKNYNDIDIKYHPFRRITTGQLLLDLTDKILMYKYNTDNSEFDGIINNLPERYKPKINIYTSPIKKNITNYQLPFDKNIVNDIFKKYKK